MQAQFLSSLAFRRTRWVQETFMCSRFPAETSGGVPALKALTGPFAMAKFCPTGGISLATAPNWLALDAVLCVGGSWIVNKGTPDVAAIEAAARAAMGLAKP